MTLPVIAPRGERPFTWNTRARHPNVETKDCTSSNKLDWNFDVPNSRLRQAKKGTDACSNQGHHKDHYEQKSSVMRSHRKQNNFVEQVSSRSDEFVTIWEMGL